MKQRSPHKHNANTVVSEKSYLVRMDCMKEMCGPVGLRCVVFVFLLAIRILWEKELDNKSYATSMCFVPEDLWLFPRFVRCKQMVSTF